MSNATSLEVPGLGRLTYEGGVWRGSWMLDEHRSLPVTIELGESVSVSDFAPAVATLGTVDLAALHVQAADDLYDLWQQTWRQSEDEALDHDGFLARLSLHAIAIHDDGDGHVAIDDGHLFGGHGIAVGFHADGSARTRAELSG